MADEARRTSRGSLQLRAVALTGYSISLSWLSLTPGDTFGPLPDAMAAMDKLGHVLVYALYAWVLLWTRSAMDAPRPSAVLPTIAYCTAFGALMEVLQLQLSPATRSFSWLDIVANALGACVAALSFRFLSFPIKLRQSQ
jgi:VanZ family protein